MPNPPFQKNKKKRKSSDVKVRPITPGLISKVRDKFEEKGWDVDDSNLNSSFSRYCSMISGLADSEQENFIYGLTDRYLVLEDKEYEKYFLYSVKNLLRSIYNDDIRNIYVIPMISPEDLKKYKVKSGGRVAYLLKGVKVKTLAEYKNQKIEVFENISIIPNNISNKDIVILTDDFIGSGDTAVKAIRYIYENKPNLRKTKLFVLSIATLKKGHDLLDAMGIDVFSTIVLHKGISDYYPLPERVRYLSMMEKIETKLGRSNAYKLGYKESEALITLIRTPNNTLPIFWYDNQTTKSPFPR